VFVDSDPNDLVADDRFRVAVENPSVTVAPTGDVAELELRVSNISIRVDGYVGEPGIAAAGGSTAGVPEWLSVKSTAVELLPGTDDVLRVRFQVISEKMVPAQQLIIPLQVRAMNEPYAVVVLPVAVTVSVVDAAVQLRAEPRLLRVQDRPDAAFALTLDNSRSNRPVRVELSGSDPELAVRFEFDPPVLGVGPSGTATVRVRVSAAPPPPGQELSRLITVSARDGDRIVETPVTFYQSTSVQVEDPVVGLQLEPALLRVRDNPVGLARVLIDNRGGKDWAHIQLTASDPEQIVAVGFDAPQLHVPPGQTIQTQVRLHAPLPELGSEATRTVTITATDAKRRTASTVVTFVQATSASPMTTLGVRLEPEVVRAHDADGATVQVILDNRKGRFRVRLQLSGADPERAVGFAFGPPVVDIEPGQTRTVELRLAAWRPPPGQEWTRQYTVSATDGQASVDASGSLRMSSSRSAMETLTLRLDPSVVRLDRRRRATLSALVDNRNGAQPVRVSLNGDDPENCIRFSFTPPMIDVESGRIGRVAVGVDAPRNTSGQEVTRSISVVATDGRTDVQASGTLQQAAAEKGPLARILFTLFGVAFMIVGVWFAWESRGLTGMDLTFNRLANPFNPPFLLDPRFDPLASAGSVIILLAIVMGLGLAARSGWLTQLAAIAGVLFMVVLLGGLLIFGLIRRPDIGAFMVILGCVLGFIGGRLARR
jgi:P pilus assembly chaperone PapD